MHLLLSPFDLVSNILNQLGYWQYRIEMSDFSRYLVPCVSSSQRWAPFCSSAISASVVSSFCCFRISSPLVTPQASGWDLEALKGRPVDGLIVSQYSCNSIIVSFKRNYLWRNCQLKYHACSGFGAFEFFVALQRKGGWVESSAEKCRMIEKDSKDIIFSSHG